MGELMNINELMDKLNLWFGGVEQTRAEQLTGPQLTDGLCFVVDDEPGIRQLFSTVLKRVGLEVEGFESAGSLLKELGRRHPQLIFLDVSLARSDAIEAMRGLTELAFTGAVILMSGRHGKILQDISMIGERQGLRMLPVLTKPFNATTIRHIVQPFVKSTKSLPRVAIDEAVRQGWMRVWYQPKIDLQRKALAGYEALARIHHPEHGILSPGSFLPGADTASLSCLTEHVLLTVLRDWDKLNDLGFALRPSVNVPVDVLVKFPIAALVRENRPRDNLWNGLIVEVVEDQVIRDLTLAQEIATQLKIYDIELAIDDFGAGYSSLERLKSFPFVELKLDMSFVKDCAQSPQNAGICKAAIDLAHNFNTLAVAEGIEQAEDLLALSRMGCDLGQGYLFAKPMPLEEFAALVTQKTVKKSA